MIISSSVLTFGMHSTKRRKLESPPIASSSTIPTERDSRSLTPRPDMQRDTMSLTPRPHIQSDSEKVMSYIAQKQAKLSAIQDPDFLSSQTQALQKITGMAKDPKNHKKLAKLIDQEPEIKQRYLEKLHRQQAAVDHFDACFPGVIDQPMDEAQKSKLFAELANAADHNTHPIETAFRLGLERRK